MHLSKQLFVNAKIPKYGTIKVWVDISYELGHGYWCVTHLPGWRYKLYVKFDEVIRIRNSDDTARYILAVVTKDLRKASEYTPDEYYMIERYESVIRKRLRYK
jgi:hypothetical protein